MSASNTANTGNKIENLRPRRTERAHRGKPDFYSPSDYENPFRRQRKRTASSEGEQKKKKGRPKGSLKTLKFDVPKHEDDSSRDNVTDEKLKSPEVKKEDTPTKPIPTNPKAKVKDSTIIKSERTDKPISTTQKISFSSAANIKSPPKHLHLCTDMSHSNKTKEMTLIKEKPKEEKVEGKESGSNISKHTDLYSSLTPEKALQCAIILAEINRKFACQNFKPA